MPKMELKGLAVCMIFCISTVYAQTSVTTGATATGPANTDSGTMSTILQVLSDSTTGMVNPSTMPPSSMAQDTTAMMQDTTTMMQDTTTTTPTTTPMMTDTSTRTPTTTPMMPDTTSTTPASSPMMQDSTTTMMSTLFGDMTTMPTTMGPTPNSGGNCLTKKADIVFLLDASLSEGPDNFKKQLNFVKQLTSSLDIRPDGVRVGLVTFSDDAHLQFHLNGHMDKTELQLAIGFVPYQSGVTNTEEGLKYVRENSFTAANGERPDAQNVVIVMTDGRSTDTLRTLSEARRLRSNGSIVVSVGIGQVDQRELEGIASGKNYTITLSDFDVLAESTALLQPLICDAIDGKQVAELYVPCEERAIDLVIVLDASASEGLTHFREQTDFAADFVSQLDIGRTKTQVGAITFSTDVNRQFYLNQYDDTQTVVGAIKRIPYTGGSTYTQKALNYIRTQFFDTSFGRRPGVPKVVLIMTDGQSTNKQATLQEAALLKQEGFIVFAVGIGENLVMTEVNAIASDLSLAYQVANFNELQNFLPKLQSAYCNKLDAVPPVIPIGRQGGDCVGNTWLESVVSLAEDPNKNACDKLADVVFVLDSSGSEGPTNFRKQVYFIGNITKDLTIGRNDVQVSVVTFSSSPYNYFYLNKYDNKYDVLDAISRTQYRPGATYTDDALRFVRTQTLSTIHGRRLGAQPVIIILTDGQSSDRTATLTEARLLQATGAVVIAIGIGTRTDDVELSAIASDPLHKFNVNSFDFLISIEQQILIETCQGGGPAPTPHPECGDKPSDIVFLMDASSSEGSTNFEKMKSFIADFSSQFEIGQGHVQISCVAFSTDVHVETFLNDTKSRAELLQKISNIRFYGGVTNTGKALEVTRTQVLTPQRGARPNAADTIILLTDGQSTNGTATQQQAKLLKAQGAQVIAIGVGANVDTDELESVASDVQHAFNVINFDALKSIELELVQTACEWFPKNGAFVGLSFAACTDTEKADVLVIIDSSSDESNALFKQEIDFISNLVDGFSVGPQNALFSVITFATVPHPKFWFNTFNNKQDIKNALQKIVYTQGDTNTHEALKFAREYGFLPFHGARNDSRQYAIVVTDGTAADLNKTISEADLLKKQGVTIMAVGIGQNADQQELEDIATDPTHVFIADNADALKTIHKDITVRTCKSIFELKTTTPMPPN